MARMGSHVLACIQEGVRDMLSCPIGLIAVLKTGYNMYDCLPVCTAECISPRTRVHREVLFLRSRYTHMQDIGQQRNLKHPVTPSCLGRHLNHRPRILRTRPDEGRGRPLATEMLAAVRPDQRRTAVQ